MGKIVEFNLIHSKNLQDFHYEINKRLQDGWCLYGEVKHCMYSVTIDAEPGYRHSYLQAMVAV